MKAPIKASSARGGILAGFGFAATSFALASTAYACTTFVGQMTVTAGEGQSTVVGLGAANATTGESHSYCQPVRPGAAATSGQTIIISVAPFTCPNVAGAVPGLKANTPHYVAFNNANLYTYNCAPGALCAANTGSYATAGTSSELCTPQHVATSPTTTNPSVKLNRPSSLGGGPAVFTTDSNGAGTVVAQLPANLFANSVTPLEDASICVNPEGGNSSSYSIMAPIHILI